MTFACALASALARGAAAGYRHSKKRRHDHCNDRHGVDRGCQQTNRLVPTRQRERAHVFIGGLGGPTGSYAFASGEQSDWRRLLGAKVSLLATLHLDIDPR
jgi:hypothetical protein